MKCLVDGNPNQGKGALINTADESSQSTNQSGLGLVDLLNEQSPQDSMMFFIKNYDKGLSSLIHNANGLKQQQFEVKGPLGESLGVHKSGLHLAFTAGTGVLPFLDLIAHMVYTSLGINERIGVQAGDHVERDFKLKLYVSFRSRQDAIALEFLEAVDSYFKKINNPCFELRVRLTNEGG
jgi:NAD(P)H-flavin reductase